MGDYNRNDSFRGRGRSRYIDSEGSGGSGRSRDRFSGRGGGFRSRDSSGKQEMFRVVCASCGEKCEVPFRPTDDRPVYCRDCYKKQNSSRHAQDRDAKRSYSNSSGSSSAELADINAKLDKILNILEGE
jgi:CxxC-x17-CxxC domain-containing protein